MDRRSFLKTLGASVAVLPLALPALPRIIGDGVHDDWAGLQAALNGEPFVDVNGLVRLVDETLHLGPGTFRITQRWHGTKGISICGASEPREIAKPPEWTDDWDWTVHDPTTRIVADFGDDDGFEVLRVSPPLPATMQNFRIERAKQPPAEPWLMRIERWHLADRATLIIDAV